ncbi:precorrin-6y C5,15-methyltransferase (decarboxylating) subunit CbiE [Oscillospiraceae bacterium PP1C4]
MKIYIVGVGMGNPALLTEQAREAIYASDCLIGSQRMLDGFPESKAKRFPAATPEKICQIIFSLQDYQYVSVLVSGDVGFYSAGKGLQRPLENYDVEYFCGVSSLQYLCSKAKTSWDDAKIISLHGREQNLIGAVMTSSKTFVLTGGKQSVSEICSLLCENAMEYVTVCVGERLSYSDEKFTTGTAHELAQQSFDPLSVMLIFNGSALCPPVTHGLPDDAFLRSDVPMTKAEVRAVSISKMKLQRGQTVWDVGAGTGSISVEIARVLYDGTVYAVEKELDALELLKQNKMRFGLKNMHIISGNAPAVLHELPAPDVVFIGGSSGGLMQTVMLALEKNPQTRFVVNAITLETVGAALDCFNRFCLCDKDIVQVSVAKSKSVGGNNMMMAQNPVYILSAGGGKPTNA